MFFLQLTNQPLFTTILLVVSFLIIIPYLILIIHRQKKLLKKKENIDHKRMIAEREREIERLEKEKLERDRELKRLEKEALKKFTAKLKESNRKLYSFAYEVSHDLQEPLRKIRSYTDLLQSKMKGKFNKGKKEYLNHIIDATERMQRLIDGLLIYSRITTPDIPHSTVNLTDVVKVVLSDLQPVIEQTKGNVQYENLPTVKANPIQMHQLMQNLISNSLKFHKHNEAPFIKVYARNEVIVNKNHSLSTPCNYYQIYVEDNGIGIEEKYKDIIFQIFKRLHSRSQYNGSGIGLAICQKIIEQHNGYITVDSIPGKGTTFIVTLPVNEFS
jgi:light-regulated signal transduction histidine kinase (bacteriophytochrome)